MISVSDCVVSAVEGRVRLRHPALKHAATADMAAAVVAGVEGVTKASVNPVTGSLLIFYEPETLSRDKLMELAEQAAALLPDAEEKRASSARCVDRLLSRRATRMVDKVLFVSLLASLVGAAAGMGGMHRVAGTIFAAASLQHLAAHRRALWQRP